MTRVISIDCHKWKKIIGISLWFGATVGLIIFSITSIQWAMNGGVTTASGNTDWLVTISWLFIVLGLTGFNKFAIWDILNNHYKWVAIRCISRDFPKEVTNKVISNEEYFKQQSESKVDSI